MMMTTKGGEPRAWNDDATALLAHDLKSPLSALSMNLEFALAELPETPGCGAVREALADCRVAGVKLGRMIANLVDVARGARGELSVHPAPTDAREIMARAVAQCDADADARHVELAADAAPIHAVVDADLLARALVALIETALRASRSSDRVELRAEVHDGNLWLRVAANAPAAMVLGDALALQFVRAVMAAHGGVIDTDEHRLSLVLPSCLC